MEVYFNMKSIICPVCSKEFIPTSNKTKYCSIECREERRIKADKNQRDIENLKFSQYKFREYLQREDGNTYVVLNDITLYKEASTALKTAYLKEIGSPLPTQTKTIFSSVGSRNIKVSVVSYNQLVELYNRKIELFRRNPTVGTKNHIEGLYQLIERIKRKIW